MRRWSRGRSSRSLRPPWWAQGTLVIACGLIVLAGGSGAGGARQDGAEPPLRDLARAREDLATAITLRTEAEREVGELQASLAAIDVASVAAAGDSAELVAALETSRTEASAAALDAYVRGQDVAELLYAMDTEAAADATYRTRLVRTRAELVVELSNDYQELRSEASAELLDALDERDRLEAQLLAAEAELAEAKEREDGAAWVVEIATVHDGADDLFVETGRTEPSDDAWAQLRFCEARARYDIDTGNGYYGAYQFDLTTWVGVGGTGNPAHAPPEEQDARARYLYALRGNQPWPVCGNYLP